MDDEVGVAADRRGEVAVRRAREAGVAEVARVVAGLLERAQDERRERLAAAPRLRRRTRRRASRSRRRARRPTAARAVSGAGGVGTSRSASFASSSSTACGSGRSWTRYSACAVPAGEERGDVLVREDHQLLDEHVRVRLALEPGLGDPAVLEAEDDLRRGDLERAAREAAAAQLRGDLVGKRELLEDLRRRLAALRLAVRQPRARADHRAVEDGSPSRRHLDRDGEPVLVRPQRAEVVGEIGRQHRRDEARHVGRERALRGALGRAASRRHEVRDVGDVHPRADPVRLAAERERVVEVLRRVRVDREASVSSRRSTRPSKPGRDPAARAARTRPARRARRAAPRARSRSASRGPSPRSTCARPRPVRTTARSPGPTRRGALRVEDDRHAGREVRLAEDQLAAPADLDDEEVRQRRPGWR